MELTASVIYCSMTLKFSIPPMQNQPSPCSFSLAFCLNSRLQHLTSVFSASPAFLPPAKRGAFSLFSYGYELFCCFLHSRKTQPFSFHAIPHSFAKTPGGSIGISNQKFFLDPNFFRIHISRKEGESRHLSHQELK